MKNQNAKLKTLLLALGLFALCQITQAVSPPPDGCYPGLTTAEGCNALFSRTTGQGNTALGYDALFSDTSGSWNTAVGAVALGFNNGDFNTALGTAALLVNTASGNTAIGSRALLNNTTGGTLGNVQGIDVGPNVAVGQQALESNTVASANTAVGYEALHSFTAGPSGLEAIGLCTAVGFQALANANGDGFTNSGFGYKALTNNTDGSGNTGIGLQALSSNTTGSGNVAIGNNALSNNDNGNSNTAVGFNAGAGVTTADNVICIGNNVFGANVDGTCFIGNIFGVTSTQGTGVFINSSGQLGTTTSSRRFKEGIKPVDKASEALFSLRPVTFHYKKELDPAVVEQFGLIAEDVEKVNPALVVRDKEGKPYSVRYDQVNAMLLNEFLKEHRKAEEQDCRIQQQETTIARQRKDFEAKITELKKDMATIVALLKEQDAKIQRVSDQVEMSKPDAQLVGFHNPR